MATSTRGSTIPTLGISEAIRYVPIVLAGVLIALFSIEHLIAIVQEHHHEYLIRISLRYELLETATDRCEDVANIIEGVVLENS